MSQAAPLESLRDIVELVGAVVPCASCHIYLREDSELVRRASKNPHPGAVDRLKLNIEQDITGSVTEHRELVVIPRQAGFDPRFRRFNELPEDRYEAFLSVPLLGRRQLVGFINIQSRDPYEFSEGEIRLVFAIGCLVGAGIGMARLEERNVELSKKLEARTVVERAKGILQADLGITEQEAYQKLQRQSQEMRRPMREIAEAVVLSHALRTHAQA